MGRVLDENARPLAASADVRAGGHSGETGLHSAAGGGQTEMVTYLLPLFGAVDVRDEFGGTPLHWAVRQHKIEVTRLLLELGADSKAFDKNGRRLCTGTWARALAARRSSFCC
jgi:ankyrin repeat protein